MKKVKKAKTVKCSITPKKSKKPRVDPRHEVLKPSWRFSSVDLGGPFAWPKGKPTELQILEKLHQFDGMTWEEISADKHHAIDISSLSKEAKKRLQKIKLDDIDEVFSFRLSGKPRIFCIRTNGVAKLLWYDPNHHVCPSIKKHT